MAYATVSDVEARWRPLSQGEAARASFLLEDAATIIDAYATVDSSMADAAMVVSCNMVIRAMSASEADTFGVSQSSMTAGPYTQSWTYSNPSGDMYLTKAERKMLKVSVGYIGSIEPAIHVPKCGCCND